MCRPFKVQIKKKKKTTKKRFAWDTVFIIAVCTIMARYHLKQTRLWGWIVLNAQKHFKLCNKSWFTYCSFQLIQTGEILQSCWLWNVCTSLFYKSSDIFFMFWLCNLLKLFVYVFVCMLTRKKKKTFSIRSALCQWNAGLHSIKDIL